MGQRHQFFVIAKVGTRYRGLAVVHHQWLYGANALKACLRLLKIFQATANRLALQHELRWAKTLKEEYWSTTVEDIVPFPFIHTCLTVGTSFDPASGSYHMVHKMPFNLPFNGGDNNNGITILDISNLEDIRYAFVDFQGMESARPVQLMTPLSARQYLNAYYEENSEEYERSFRKLLRDFENRSIIKVDSLDSAWPDNWEENKENTNEVDHVNLERLQITATTQPSSLRTTAMAKVLDEAFATPILGLAPILADLEALPDFWPSLKSRVLAQSQILTESLAARELFGIGLENDSVIDLSFFKLSDDQLGQLLLRNTANPRNLKILSLSGNQGLTEETLKKILLAYPNLRTLHLLNTPQISLDAKLNLVKESNVSEVLLSELLALPFLESTESDVPLDCITPLVTQVVFIRTGQDYEPFTRLPGSGLDIEKLLNDRDQIDRGSLTFPLININLPPQAELSGYASFIDFHTKEKDSLDFFIEPVTDIGRTLAFSLATGSQLEDDKKWKVGTISSTFYRRPERTWPPKARKPEQIRKGQWTLLMIYEQGTLFRDPPCGPRIRYAFVTSDSDTVDRGDGAQMNQGLVVADIEVFIEQAIVGEDSEEIKKQILQEWKGSVENASSSNPEYKLRVCEMEEVVSWLRSKDFVV